MRYLTVLLILFSGCSSMADGLVIGGILANGETTRRILSDPAYHESVNPALSGQTADDAALWFGLRIMGTVWLIDKAGERDPALAWFVRAVSLSFSGPLTFHDRGLM